MRIEEAKYQLDQSNDLIAEIAASIGFYDATYFTKVFRKQEGITPHAYRQQKKAVPMEERRMAAYQDSSGFRFGFGDQRVDMTMNKFPTLAFTTEEFGDA